MQHISKPVGLVRKTIFLDKGDIDLTLANQTQQNLLIDVIPVGAHLLFAEIMNTGTTITSTGTLATFSCSLGTSSGGSDLVAAVDLQTSGNSAILAVPYPIPSTQQNVYFGAVPAGSGANFSTLSNTLQFRITLLLAVTV